MKRWWLIPLAILLFSGTAQARAKTQGYCSLQGIYQRVATCTVSVYVTGTITLATLFSDNSSTPLSNPFTADANGLWFFYADNQRVDIRFSGGDPPISPAYTLSDVLINEGSGAATVTNTAGALTLNKVILGNGGVDIKASTVGILGTGPSIATVSGAIISGDCVKVDASANFVDSGAPCTTGGTTTNFTSGALPPLFTTSVTNPTTTPALSFTLNAQTANKVFVGPISGGAALPTYRLLDPLDIPSLDAAKVTTSIFNPARLVTIVNASKCVHVNAGGSQLETTANDCAPDFKHQGVTTGSIAGSSNAAVTLTWTIPFSVTPDAPQCSVVEATTSASTLRVHHIESFSTTVVVVRIVNDDAGAKTGTLYCIAVR